MALVVPIMPLEIDSLILTTLMIVEVVLTKM